MVWLLVTYDPSTGFLSRFTGDSTNRRVRNEIASFPSRFTRTIVLPELERVSVEDFVDWYAGYVDRPRAFPRVGLGETAVRKDGPGEYGRSNDISDEVDFYGGARRGARLAS